MNLQSNYQELQSAVERLDDLPERALAAEVASICDQALEVKSLGEVLVCLESDNFVQFTPTVAKELRFFNAFLDERELRRRKTVEIVRTTVAPVVAQVRNLARLEREMTILLRPAAEEGETERFVARLFEIARFNPEGFKRLPMQFTPSTLMSCEVVPQVQFQGSVWAWSTERMPRHDVRFFVPVGDGENGLHIMQFQLGNGTQEVQVRRAEVRREKRDD